MKMDMRAVVGHLSRNFVIEGDDTEDWGCHVFIAGYEEVFVGGPTVTKTPKRG